MAQEDGDLRGGLREDALGDALLVRAQVENAQAVEPGGDWVADAMCQVLTGREVDLEPGAFFGDAGPDGVAEEVRGEACDRLGEVAIDGGVVDRLAG